ncbi:MAG TPA: 4-hydroxy-tetrahydrodipicolinate synthase [Candidatus Limnocylindrales bacterium]
MTRINRTNGTSNGTGRPTLHGAFTALVTPFSADGSLDEASLRQLVRWQVLAGIDGLVPCGTTGESPTLTQAERDRVIALTVETVAERPSRSRVTVIAGTGTNDTAATIAATRRAAELGADAALVVAPYYNRPDQRMLEAHYRAVADEGGLPIVVYNVPSRTGTNIEAATLLRLAEHPRIVAVKEASGNLDQIAWICRNRPSDFAVLAGDDSWTLAVLAMGGHGVVSVASNEIPGEMVALCAAARAGDWETARRIHDRWLPLFRANFAGGPNPVPVKAALSMIGLIGDVLRPPLLPLEDSARQSLADVLRQAGLVELSGGRIVRTERTVVGEQVVA